MESIIIVVLKESSLTLTLWWFIKPYSLTAIFPFPFSFICFFKNKLQSALNVSQMVQIYYPYNLVKYAKRKRSYVDTKTPESGCI